MDVERYKEELRILRQEMMVFMKFYKDKMLPSLEMQQTNLLQCQKVQKNLVCARFCLNVFIVSCHIA